MPPVRLIWATSRTATVKSPNGRRNPTEHSGNCAMRQRDRLSRREMIRLSAGTLLAAGWWPGVLRAAGAGHEGDFHFVAVNDVHYLDQRCGKWVERVVQQIRAHPEKIALCLL